MTMRVVSPTQKAFNVWGIVLAIWALYRGTIGQQAPIVFDELIFKPLVFIWPVYLFVVHYEHKAFFHSIWLKFTNWRQDLGYALFISAPLLAFFFFLLFAKNANLHDAPLLLVLALATAITEETLSRGLISVRIYEETGSFLKTLFQSSILHLFLRVPRVMTMPNLFGDRLLYAMVAEVALSFVVTFVFLQRKSLLPAIVVRAIYVFVMLSLLK
ncbi:MAG: CPBP family glutamic-type intramembrane protease [Candidatus Roizmanbacteria bacterium]